MKKKCFYCKGSGKTIVVDVRRGSVYSDLGVVIDNYIPRQIWDCPICDEPITMEDSDYCYSCGVALRWVE